MTTKPRRPRKSAAAPPKDPPKRGRPNENLSRRTMFRMTEKEQATWDEAIATQSTRIGLTITNAQFIRSACNELAKRWLTRRWLGVDDDADLPET